MPDEPLNFFVLIREGAESDTVRRIRLSQEAQKKLGAIFEQASEHFLHDGLEQIAFDGRYHPDDEEILYVDDFPLPDAITHAVQEPTACEELVLERDNLPPIKAVFTGKNGDAPSYMFQLFQKNQYITRKGFSLIFSDDTFRELQEPGLVVTYDLAAYFQNNALFFRSYTKARQIFDLTEYYREATDGDIEVFLETPGVYVENPDAVRQNADTWIRRKLAFVQDRGLLNEETPEKISERAREFGVDLPVIQRGGQNVLHFPETRRDLKPVLRFLDEDYFEGPVSAAKFLSNSKRQVD